MSIPRSHPRYRSLVMREEIADGVTEGIVHQTGLIAHGRGEAFDYLLGERTIPPAAKAEKAAAARMLHASHPVVSVNGNTAVLAAGACVELAAAASAAVEVNLFHRTDERIQKIAGLLEEQGATEVLGLQADARIPGLEHDRGRCSSEGIAVADVVLVPLEDGDRCQALKDMGKTVIAVDLNPLSRTARAADVTVVDNVVRALPAMTRYAGQEPTVEPWDNDACLRACRTWMCQRLRSSDEPEEQPDAGGQPG